MDLGLPIWGYPHDLGNLQIEKTWKVVNVTSKIMKPPYMSATMEHLGESLEDQTLIAVLTPLVKHPDVKGRILRIEPRLGHDSKKHGNRRPGTIKIIEK